ncbi:arylesterase [Lutimonas halocynthiae]|uniref:arylesterase n=1 Tax=Lutimonas halocynthiae TaxID=1446477 RepID=UPI0025B2CF6C|nr:arylesterase [Lutimonas halocynthiae]MDN3642075.1 arylesterase [Lutimonas halocynthiae]
MGDVLKFCYLSICFLVMSCAGNDAKKIDKQEKKESINIETQSETSQKIILFFGNSLTAGMGLEVEEAFPALIQKKLDSALLPYNVINAGLSGETTASGKNRLSWLLKQKVDVFVLELGANDGLRGIPLDETKKNLQNMIDEVKKHNPEVVIVLAGMQIPPNMGIDYTKDFQAIFPDLAAENNLALIPFLLKDVAGRSDLNQQDGIHPTAEGQKILANNVWEILEETL